MDRHGPRLVIESGVVLLAGGLLLAPYVGAPWHLYITLGALVGCGANLMSFTAQSLYLPNWFRRRRGLALSLAFAGVGAGAIVILPWQQSIITADGWRASCTAMGLTVVLVLLPLNLLVRRRPEDLGLEADGGRTVSKKGERLRTIAVVDADWAARDWTLAAAVRTARFWWIALAFFSVLFAWYAVQIHQTKYLLEIGFDAQTAAWALGFVSVAAIPGQIGFGALSDRIGREWVWSIACAGFAVCYGALIALHAVPSIALLYLMVVSQGAFGYALSSVMGPIVAEIFEGPNYGAIFGTLTVALIGGGAAGPWVTGLVYDAYGSYTPAFALAIALCAVSALAIWIAAPRKVRTVPGKS